MDSVYNFAQLKQEHRKFYEKVKRSCKRVGKGINISAEDAHQMIENGFSENKKRRKEITDIAREIGADPKELESLDAELDYSLDERKAQTPDRPGCCSFATHGSYVLGRITSEESKRAYEHYDKCRKCLRDLFTLEIHVTGDT